MSEAPKQSEQAAGKSSPTKGPWHRDTSTGSLGHDIYNSGENEELLATVYPMERDGLHNSWVANANLIASAPLLYEYAKRKAEEGDAEAVKMLDLLHLGNFMEAALARAEGGK